MTDMVNNPPHYTQAGIECIEAIEAATVGKSGFEGALVANVIKYLWRYEAKNGLQDVQKARWYLGRLLSHLEGVQHPSQAVQAADGWTAEAIKAAAFPSTGVFGPMTGEWPDESRFQTAAAEDEAFARIEASQPRIDSGPMWVEHDGSEMPKVANVIEVNYRDGNIDKGRPAAFFWNHSGADDDIVRWRQPWPEGKPYTGQGGVLIQCPGCTATSCECRP